MSYLTDKIIKILEIVLPGSVIKKSIKWDKDIDKPLIFWKTKDLKYSIFYIEGERLSQAKIDSIKKAHKTDYNPVVILTDQSKLSAIARCYEDTFPYLICNIAGDRCLINPLPKKLFQLKKYQRISRTRMPLDVIREILRENNLKKPLKRKINTLIRNYGELKRSSDRENQEQKILDNYGKSILKSIGFTKERLIAPDTLRSLEISKLISSRDHYFHSFQNYFLGLYAICKLYNYFENWKERTYLNWSIDSYDIWFLTSIWHDSGYPIQKCPDIISSILDSPESTEHTDRMLRENLQSEIIQQALTDISSIIIRLLEPENFTTGWTRPGVHTRKSPKQKKVIEALKENYFSGHGASSAILLYKNLMKKVDRMRRDNQKELLCQIILLSCCSIPFHELKFRESMRNSFGKFKIRNDSMPFAALLAFIDSIQEDQRDLTGIMTEVRFLKKLLFKKPRFIKAKVNISALSNEDILWKIIESRDVCATLLETEQTIGYRYPKSMIG